MLTISPICDSTQADCVLQKAVYQAGMRREELGTYKLARHLKSVKSGGSWFCFLIVGKYRLIQICGYRSTQCNAVRVDLQSRPHVCICMHRVLVWSNMVCSYGLTEQSVYQVHFWSLPASLISSERNLFLVLQNCSAVLTEMWQIGITRR